ncbi:PREDICTED: putative pentatricopeptide repeat-containing protein At3g08820 [Tarenaya hassleriana]|uniref:putative pentatricopeptide repeat-containing protein At3g08820 n=1 Tax=Tarenaya hassleriana TaxID=28532 RepID=UPI00053C2CDC|nr:PREDICTED: putative pentatricopeptide repeat-containing protein At3g08820 [Tarenaya hassleriana]
MNAKAHRIKTLILNDGISGTGKHLKQIHAAVIRHNLHDDTYILNLLLKRTLRLGLTFYSHLIFSHTTHQPNIFLFNTLLRGFVSNNLFHESVHLFLSMRSNGLSPDSFTFPFLLKACSMLPNLDLASHLHSLLLKSGFGRDVFSQTSLLSLYARCGRLDDAIKVFDDIPERNVVSWTAIISGYISAGKHREAVDVFKKLLGMGVRPDSYLVVRILSACAQLGDLSSGEWIDQYVMEEIGMYRNSFLSTSLVDFYAKCGNMEKARSVFEAMPEKDIVTWSSMIQGYASNSLPREATELFFRMLRKNLKPDRYSIVGFLSSCASLGALELGEWGSNLIDRREFLTNPVMGTALIDMYAKCGTMARGFEVFRAMEEKDRVVMNATITGLAKNGHVELSFAVFGQTEKLGIRPDGNTFLGLLCGCAHAGLVGDGRRFFDGMSRIFSLEHKIEHYGCMVDILGRAGLLDEAYNMINDMPLKPNAVVWGALLSGCRLHKEMRLAERVLKELVKLEPWNSGNYVQLSNIYSGSGRWDEAAEVREVMNEKGMKKIPGCSWIELEGTVHEFLVDDRSHPQIERIYGKLEELGNEMRKMGFVAKTEGVMFDVEEEEKERAVRCHSEKLAVAYGLMMSKSEEDVIRVVKNLRVCGDCHEAMKLISKITGREIVVRDNNRFHCFRQGFCSCNDYW